MTRAMQLHRRRPTAACVRPAEKGRPLQSTHQLLGGGGSNTRGDSAAIPVRASAVCDEREDNLVRPATAGADTAAQPWQCVASTAPSIGPPPCSSPGADISATKALSGWEACNVACAKVDAMKKSAQSTAIPARRALYRLPPYRLRNFICGPFSPGGNPAQCTTALFNAQPHDLEPDFVGHDV